MFEHFLKPTATRVGAFALAGMAGLLSPLVAQHEVDDSEAEVQIIRISGNENAFGVSPMVTMAIMQDIENLGRYAREESVELTNMLSEMNGVPSENIILTAGSGPVLTMAGMAFGSSGKTLISVEPGYMQLVRAWQAHGGKVELLPLKDDLSYDLEAIEAAVDEDTGMVYICNPNNPTGTIVDPAELEEFVKRVSKKVPVFVDEAYLELSEGGLEANGMAHLVAEGHNVIIARTFSKVYGLAGLRVGYGMMHEDLLEKVRPFYQGGPNRLGLVAASASLQDTAHFDYSVKSYKEVRDMVKKEFDEMGLEYADAQGSFIFVKTGMPITMFQKQMEDRNILVGRPFPPMFDWARISIGTQEEMETFLAAMKEVLNTTASAN